jgi:hypothetical protein
MALNYTPKAKACTQSTEIPENVYFFQRSKGSLAAFTSSGLLISRVCGAL